jgi:hypothetical protein
MTRQSKNARNLAKARDITKLHKSGEKGPSKTTPAHGKKWGYRTNPDVQKRIAEQLKASQPQEKTSGRKILRGAGGASKPLNSEAA